MNYLVIGNKGQLGSEFENELRKSGHKFIGVDLPDLDITNYKDVNLLFSDVKPGIVINCAAYNDVDGAEGNEETALKVNAEAVKYLAYASYKKNAFFIHFSSDYVFDGTKNDGLYTEVDKTNPINKYGSSKLAGEINLRNEIEKYLLFRLSWVYGNGKQNFICKFRNWAEKNAELKITNDEVSIPSSAKMIVNIVLKSIDQGLEGLFHLTNSGYCSRYDWAGKIRDILDLKTELVPVGQDYFNLPAKRPKFSAMSNAKISSDLGIEISDWEDSLKDFLKKSTD